MYVLLVLISSDSGLNEALEGLEKCLKFLLLYSLRDITDVETHDHIYIISYQY